MFCVSASIQSYNCEDSMHKAISASVLTGSEIVNDSSKDLKADVDEKFDELPLKDRIVCLLYNEKSEWPIKVSARKYFRLPFFGYEWNFFLYDARLGGDDVDKKSVKSTI